MSTKQRDILSTQENADDNPKQNSTLTERETITGTPFTLIKQNVTLKNQNEIWFTVMGDHRITEYTETKEEQIEKLETEKWLLIMHMIVIAVKKIGVENETYKNWKEKNKEQEINQVETEEP